MHVVLQHALQKLRYEHDPALLLDLSEEARSSSIGRYNSRLHTVILAPVVLDAVLGTPTVTTNALPNVSLQSSQWQTIGRVSVCLVRRIVCVSFLQ